MYLSDLIEQGWATIQFEESSELGLRRRMLSFAMHLGEPVRVRTGKDIFTVLVPTSAEFARPHSLSRRFARGEFELHNDTAHWIRPCRYIFVACVDAGEGSRATLLLDTRELPLESEQIELLETAPMRIQNGRNSYYSTIFNRERPFVRFDVGCMVGASTKSLSALCILKKENWPSKVREFHWQPGIGLVIDNWRILHGRGAAKQDDPKRRLLRISFL
jgi:hypothetical protein